MAAMVEDIYEYVVATKTHKIGSHAGKNVYANVFRMVPKKLTVDKESNTPLHWDWERFVAFRSAVETLLLETVADLVAAHNSAGFEVAHLQPILSNILQRAVELTELPEMSGVTIEANLPFSDTKIIVDGTPYSYHGNGDVSVVVVESGMRVGLGGVEATRGGKHFLTSKKQELSADAITACAQCAAQILGFSTVYERLYEECKAFIQLVVNGREWMLVCSTKAGYRQRHYSHTQPVALFPLDTAGKATAPPAADPCYTVVAHMIAVMMDCTCYLLHNRQIESFGAQLRKALIIESNDGEDEEDEDMEDADRDPPGTDPLPTKKGATKGTSNRKASGASGVAVNKYGLTEENMVTHNLHFGRPRSGLMGMP
jgi:hypothetical protein